MNENCGCCASAAGGPRTPFNRPGLSALAYRLGTHATFMEAMQARLSSADYPALRGLTTRDRADPAVAFLDAWAGVADVLTFYQERIANEGYLRTATERRSVQELGWLVGYKLRPGVAASTYLAYTIDDNTGDADVDVPAGSKAQSVPGPGEQMQTFETSDDLTARVDWNALLPRTTRPINVTPDAAGLIDALYFQGITTNLSPNDRLLFVFDGAASAPVPRTVATVEPDAAANRTRVTLQAVPDLAAQFVTAVQNRAASYLSADPGFDPQGLATAALTTLQTDARGTSDPKALYQELVTAQAALGGARDKAIAAGDLTLQDWLRGVVTDLGQLAGWVAPALAAPVASGNGQGLVGTLTALVGPLTLPPAVRPASAQGLPRSQQQELAPNSDGFVQTLTELHPDLDPKQLYTALGNAGSAPPPFTVYALRKRAAVFGNNAPQRAIVNNGQITGYREWDLTKAAGFSAFSINTTFVPPLAVVALRDAVVGAPAATPPPSWTVHTAVQIDGVWGEKDIAPGGSADFTVGTAKVHVEVRRMDQPQPYTLVYTFTRNDFGTLSLEVTADANRLQVVPGDANAVTISGSTLARDSTFAVVGQLSRGLVPTENPNVVSLDASYPQVIAGSWVVLEKPDPAVLDHVATVVLPARVKNVSEGTRADYGITAKGTQVTLDRAWLVLPPGANPDDFRTIRNTAVFAQSEALELAEAPTDPVAEPVAGGQIELDRLVAGLTSGRWMVVSGERIIPGTSGVNDAELVMLQALTQGGTGAAADTTHSTLVLANPLAYSYKADTVTISANVVEATHGETKQEVLGGGDGSQPFQQFALKQATSQSPLTYVAAATPTGVQSTLQVSVNDVVWHEQDSLLVEGPTDHVFTTSADDDDNVTVTFGDGVHGARLPTGSENVKAVYRVGIGQAGNVSAGQISLLASRPLGVKAVVNPLEASGGADPDDRDSARRNIPLGATALGRLVSVQDYADFARTFGGIGKANAARRAAGRRQLVHLTVAGAEGAPIDTTSDTYQNLVAALYDFGDPSEAVEVKVAERLLLLIAAHIFLAPDYLWEGVEPQVRAALEAAFAFDKRDLGQPAFLSEVIALIQDVEGVLYVKIDTFAKIDQDSLPKGSPLPSGIAPRGRVAVGPDQIAYVAPAVPRTVILNVGTA